MVLAAAVPEIEQERVREFVERPVGMEAAMFDTVVGVSGLLLVAAAAVHSVMTSRGVISGRRWRRVTSYDSSAASTPTDGGMCGGWGGGDCGSGGGDSGGGSC
ncbi:hypothetical protein [Pseudonocardia adelaidensis]|uniref:TIGR04222 domain-containing membrane protein n=1 Tax=Pseudonocardia adelaidensis TaxID=648754 RepID=A0ABP9NNX2_9PSEU